MPSTLRLLALTTILGLAACQPGAPQPTVPAIVATAATEPEPIRAPDGDEPLLRTYSVPSGQTRAIVRALSSALSSGKETPPLGTVQRLPDGRLVVVAPQGIHDGITALLGDLEPGKAPPVSTAEFDYWVVFGEPAEAASGLDVVPAITPALQAITESHGPLKFSLHESMRLSSLIEESAEADGHRISARQVVSETGGHLIADLEMSVAVGSADRIQHSCHGSTCKRLKSRVHLEPDQLLVVGQTGVTAGEGKGEPVSKTMFYIVRGRLRTGGV